ncbi:hypothetical protein BXZ70DRAFT_951104 [Cristinia sonorae]|uniref:NACHT domain-containing protein n=1 Tax=Cristinia sonorae TaxID=1940300 RepID=A0A8K0UJT6_9AGAR|nr:hypothetical protein BXZ70DRAFT_951104 [Cristinia sonorae]
MVVRQLQVLYVTPSSDIDLAPQCRCFGEPTKYRIRVSAAGCVYATRKSTDLQWEEILTLSCPDNALLKFELLDYPFLPIKNHLLALTSRTWAELLELRQQATGHRVVVPMSSPQSRTSFPSYFAHLALLSKDEVEVVRVNVDLASLAASDLASPTGIIGGLTYIAESLKAFTAAVDQASQIHPIASVAWSIVSGVLKACQKQMERDHQLGELVTAMVEAYRSLESSNGIKGQLDHHLVALIDATIRQTVECALFIRSYSGHGFLMRTIAQTFGKESSAKMREMIQGFQTLQRNRTEASAFQAVIVTTRLQSVITQMREDQLDEILQRVLRPFDLDTSNRAVCLPQTRTRLLQRICLHLTSPSADNVLWVHGAAGCGKSTIAKTVSSFFEAQKRLAAYIAFNRFSGESSASEFIRTLAYQLATFHPLIRQRIVLDVPKGPALGRMNVSQLFDTLINAPLSTALNELAMEGPFIIVLDALDECGSVEDRADLLSVLKKKLPSLPNFIRVLITSRPEVDIRASLNPVFNVSSINLNAKDGSDIDEDIKLFLKERLTEIAKAEKNKSFRLVESGWPDDEDLNSLVGFASGLFIWAQTLFKAIDVSHNPSERLKSVLEGTRPIEMDASSVINQLYTDALELASGDWDDDEFRLPFNAIFGTLVAADSAPLNCVTLDELLGDTLTVTSEHTLQHFGSVVTHDFENPRSPVELHPSFREYLSDRNRCGSDAKWYINVDDHCRKLALRCMEYIGQRHGRLSSSESTFNIRRGKDFTALDHACLYWHHYLARVKVVKADTELASSLMKFLLHSLNHWFVAMTTESFGSGPLLHLFQNAIRDTVLKWAKVHGEIIFGSNALEFAHFIECYTVNHVRDLTPMNQNKLALPPNFDFFTIRQYRFMIKSLLTSELSNSPPDPNVQAFIKSSLNMLAINFPFSSAPKHPSHLRLRVSRTMD